MSNIFDKSLLEKIGTVMINNKQTVAVAESVTSGFLQAAFSSIPDASKFFQGGITAYNIAQKYLHLKVEPLHALATNCVSEKVAVEMAQHVCNTFSSDWGLAVTGYASRVPESENRLFAYYAVSFKGTLLESGELFPQAEDPQQVQLWYVDAVLKRWKRLLDQRS